MIRGNYEVITGAEVDRLCSSLLLMGGYIALDTETYYDEDYIYNQHGDAVISKFIAGRPQNRPFCVTIWDCDEERGYYIKEEDIHRLTPVLTSDKIHKIFHNLNYDMHMFYNVGIELKAPLHDTMALAQLTDEERECRRPDGTVKKSKALKNLGYHFLNEDAHEYEDGVKDARILIARERECHKDDVSYKDVAEYDFDLMVNYAIYDTELTGRIFKILMADLIKQDLQTPYEIDMGAIIAGVQVERNGMKVNIDKAKKWQKKINERITELQDMIYEKVGGNVDFNYNSTAELVQAYELLFDVTWGHFTAKGEPSTTAQVLKQFYSRDDDMRDFTNLILEIRTAEKVNNTFIEGILHYVQHTGRVHPNFHIVANDFDKGGTVTGRLSSSNPNFQNFPKEPFTIGGVEYEIRELFVVDEGRIFVYSDADQQEYRLLGHYGKDKDFVQFVKDGKDIHTATASLLFNVPYETVTKEQRKKAKTLNFGQ